MLCNWVEFLFKTFVNSIVNVYLMGANTQVTRVMVSPCVDEVLCQADAGRWACDGNLTIGASIHWICNLDLSAWHLPDLTDLGSLASNDTPNKLRHKREESSGLGNMDSSWTTKSVTLTHIWFGKLPFKLWFSSISNALTSFGMVISWQPVCAEASIPKIQKEKWILFQRHCVSMKTETDVETSVNIRAPKHILRPQVL